MAEVAGKVGNVGKAETGTDNKGKDEEVRVAVIALRGNLASVKAMRIAMPCRSNCPIRMRDHRPTVNSIDVDKLSTRALNPS